MKKRKQLLLCIVLVVTMLGYSQQKKVAILTFYADKNIDLSKISPSADLILKNSKLSDDPSFKLETVLEKFHKAFFTTYINNFPFQVLEEEVVHKNQAYKDYHPDYKKLAIPHVNDMYSVINGYKVIRSYKPLVKETTALAKELGVDGIMFVSLTFDFNKTGIGKFGYISIRAKVAIDLYDKNGKSIFQFNELAGSKKKAVMVGGLPIMKPEKILPMCQSAVDQLMKDLDKKIKRLSKKTLKKFK